jgi:hypothetical protein
MRPFIRNTVFFIGWILSPLTFWNDAFVNIPIAYLLANLFIRFFPVDFLFAVVIFYWLSNFAGIVMMYFSGKDIFRDKKRILVELLKLFATMLAYSILLVLLNKAGVLRPL